jgi:hypothetical protein
MIAIPENVHGFMLDTCGIRHDHAVKWGQEPTKNEVRKKKSRFKSPSWNQQYLVPISL